MKKGCAFLLIIAGLVAVIILVIVLKKNNRDSETKAEMEEYFKQNPIDTTNVNNERFSSDADYNNKALKEIQKEPKVKEALITEANVLYVSVIDDGTRRDGYAEYLCQVLKDNKSSIHKVKIVKYGSTNSENRDNAYGVLLGESNCNF